MELYLLGEYRKGDPNRGIRDVIAKAAPLILGPSSDLREACRRMHEQNVGSVLVVGDGRLLGIFTGRDAVKAAAVGASVDATLETVMTRNPITICPSASAIDALRTMNDGGFRHLPVVDDGAVVGIVTRNDFHGLEIDRLDQEEHLKETLW
ncbi:MAG: CBS domain-containing protein [Proteobacteria bacterium]|nr:CBS domain-containing protein [Pseudomonadota bacterium]